MQTYCVSAGAGAGWAGPGAGPPPSSVPQCLRSQCGPLRFCWGWSWWTLLFEAGGWRQQPGGPGVRAAKDRPLRVLNSTPPPLCGVTGGVEQMCCLGNRWQVHRPRKPLPPRSRPPTPRALAIWPAGTVVEAQCPAQHSQACSAASHLEEQKGGSSRLSCEPRLSPCRRCCGV